MELALSPTLNDRQKRFCLEYLVDQNATQAALRAGYSPLSARQISSELMARPDVRTEIDRLSAECAGKLQISVDWVLQSLMEELRIAQGQVPGPSGKVKSNPGKCIRILYLLGKFLGMWNGPTKRETVPEPVPMGQNFDLSKLSDDELEMLNKITKKACGITN
ncbi:MAG: terminase small subunit [Zavarzinella sp.]